LVVFEYINYAWSHEGKKKSKDTVLALLMTVSVIELMLSSKTGGS